MNWLMSNPKIPVIKKMMYEFLKDRYPRNDQMIERIVVSSLQTEADMKAFVALIVDCYEEGYMRAVKDHEEQLKKVGVQVKVVKQPQ